MTKSNNLWMLGAALPFGRSGSERTRGKLVASLDEVHFLTATLWEPRGNVEGELV